MQFKLTEQNNKNKGKTGEKQRTLRQRHPQNHKTNNKPNEPAQKKLTKKGKHLPLVFSYVSPTNKAHKSETKIFLFRKGKTLQKEIFV